MNNDNDSQDQVVPKKKFAKKLSPKQKKFIKAYSACGNATQASIEAGYQAKSRDSHSSIGWELLTKPQIKECLLASMTKQGLTSENLTEKLSKLIHETTDETALKALRTALEILGQVGSGANTQVAVQVNLSQDTLARIRSAMASERPQEVYTVEDTSPVNRPDVLLETTNNDTPPVDNMGTTSV